MKSRLIKAWHAFAIRVAWRIADARHTAHGFEIRSLSDGDEGENGKFICQVVEALETIARVDPRRYCVISERLAGILIFTYAFGHNGFYSKETRRCVLSPDYLRRETRAERIALTIVHEATHAKIADLGISTDVHVHRIERICVSAEIAFAKKLDEPKGWVADARERWDDIPQVYNPRYRLEVYIDGLERWKAPRVLKWLALRAKRRELRRIKDGEVRAKSLERV